jgi:lysophospholipase L1-like esterase
VKVRDASTGRELKRGVDYELCPDWGTIGLVGGSGCACTGSVSISYAYKQRRIDTVVLRKDGGIALRKGVPDVVTPSVPECGADETVLGNVYVDAATKCITDENLLPLTPSAETAVCAFNPPRRTCEKLRAGGKVKIMAWGDSVTVGCYLPEADRWQNRFVGWLRKKYPTAEIELISNAWGGRTTSAYLREPPGSRYNFKETVLDVCPDLVISEFVNDGGMKEKQFSEIYERTLLPAFREKGIEWVVLTPHYVRPDWMNLAGVKRCDEDPRVYVRLLRDFARKEGVGLADASMLWGGLWRRGIPYVTLLVNDINHPNAFGMSLFDEALRELFGGAAPCTY